MADDLNAERIEAAVTGTFGTSLRYADEIGSTNTEALDWAANGAPEGSVVTSDHQTGGRGRWGRTWFSAPGKLLQFSLILRPDLEPSRHGLLTAGLGVASARAVTDVTGLPVSVKWPNDLVIEGRKLAGMLVETAMERDRIATAVCGIGINVHLDEADLPEELRDSATSLAIEGERAGRKIALDRSELLARILAEIERRYDAMKGTGSDELLAEATELSAVLGREVVIRFADGTTIEGRARGFDRDAALLLEAPGGTRPIHVGEIEQLRPVRDVL